MWTDKLTNLLRLREKEAPPDLSQFNDPLAEAISWKPVRRGGANFRTHEVIRPAMHLAEIVATPGLQLFSAVFVLFPLGLIGLFYWKNPADVSGIMIFVCSLLTIVGLWMVYRSTLVTVFDQHTRKCHGYLRSAEDGTISLLPKAKEISFSEMHALQILRERVSGNNSRYWSYELNLVLHDGQRFLLMDHANVSRLREDAHTLSQVLQVPIWDVTRDLA